MRAEQVIATHGNTDFDAFGAMLAARLLYPDAVVAVGALNRNVRDFYRLHADGLGEIEKVALDPTVEKALFDHHGEEELPDWIAPETAVLSTDGALTTTLAG